MNKDKRDFHRWSFLS